MPIGTHPLGERLRGPSRVDGLHFRECALAGRIVNSFA